VRGVTERAGVAAVLDERDGRRGIAEDVIPLGVDRSVDPTRGCAATHSMVEHESQEGNLHDPSREG
jgi:hypothetical protein